MHGLRTIERLNRDNSEANRIVEKHRAADQATDADARTAELVKEGEALRKTQVGPTDV